MPKNKQATLLLFLMLFPLLPVFGQEPIQAEVISLERLNVREQPCISDTCPIIGQLTYGTQVQVIGRSYELYYRTDPYWVYIQEPQTRLSGWVSASYLRFTPEIELSATLPTIPYDTSLYTFMPAEPPFITAPLPASVREAVYLDDNPYRHSGTPLGSLSSGESITVLGRPNYWDNYDTLYLKIQTINGIVGWVRADRINLPEGIAYWSLPVVEIPTPSRSWVRDIFEPVPSQGQLVIYLHRYTVRLYREPSSDSEYITSPNRGEFLVVYGQNASQEWVFVKVLGTGEVGWVIARLLSFPDHFDEATLPILESLAYPNLPPERPSIGSLSGTITRDSQLRVTASIQAAHQDFWVTEGQTVTVIGRDEWANMFKIQVEDRVGWVSTYRITIIGDIFGLTIFAY